MYLKNKLTFVIFGIFIILVAVKLINNKKVMSSSVIESINLLPLEAAVDDVDENTLVLFDVKSVLVVNQDQILTPNHKEQYNDLRNNIKAKYSLKEAEQLLSIILMQFRPILVDNTLPDILTKLRAKGAKLLGLTSGYSGPFGHIKAREDLRLAKLREVGVDFANSLPDVGTIQIRGIQGANDKQVPLYKGGIIFTSKLPKGDVLKEFLKHIDFKPNKIIFVDNQMKNITSVQNICQDLYSDHKTKFFGIHYTNVLNSERTKLDIERANYQFEILEKELRWLSDHEASEALKN